MDIAMITNEYPPHVYGGAGVHIEYLTRELAKVEDNKHSLRIVCFGDQKERSENRIVEGVQPDFEFPFQDLRYKKLFATLLKDLVIAGSLEKADIIHCHTWYTHLAGCLLKQLLAVPLVLTTHSLEPQRPWKEEQLGAGYRVSSWVEKTAYENADGVIAVSESMKSAVHDLYGAPYEKIRVIHNGIDVDQYKPTPNLEVLRAYRIKSDRPFILFVGRITRQKGIIHLVNAIKYIRAGLQIVLCAGAPDTEEIGKEMTERVELAQRETENEIIWIREIVPKEPLISLYTHATVFICPSVYEPFGLINLEAMACGTPVVASAVGGVPEAVVHEETGLLVPIQPRGPGIAEPVDPDQFSRDLAKAINTLLSSPDKIEIMGKKGRERVEEHFRWPQIADKTLAFYRDVIASTQ